MASIRDAADVMRAVIHERAEWDLSELYAALGDLDELTRGVQSVVDRVCGQVEGIAGRPELRADELGALASPAELAQDATRSLAGASAQLESANRQVGVAWSKVGRLYIPDHVQPDTPHIREPGRAPSAVSGTLPGAAHRRPRPPDLPPRM